MYMYMWQSQVENEHCSTVSGIIQLVISLECFIEITPDFLCPFMNDWTPCTVNFRATATGSLLNIYNSTYANVRFLPVTATYVHACLHAHVHACYMQIRRLLCRVVIFFSISTLWRLRSWTDTYVLWISCNKIPHVLFGSHGDLLGNASIAWYGTFFPSSPPLPSPVLGLSTTSLYGGRHWGIVCGLDRLTIPWMPANFIKTLHHSSSGINWHYIALISLNAHAQKA